MHRLRVPDRAGRDPVADRGRRGQYLFLRAGSAAEHPADRAPDQGRRAASGSRRLGGVQFDQTRFDRLCFYLARADDVANKLLELCLATGLGVLVISVGGRRRMSEFLPPSSIRPVGFTDDEALLPVTRALVPAATACCRSTSRFRSAIGSSS